MIPMIGFGNIIDDLFPNLRVCFSYFYMNFKVAES